MCWTKRTREDILVTRVNRLVGNDIRSRIPLLSKRYVHMWSRHPEFCEIFRSSEDIDTACHVLDLVDGMGDSVVQKVGRLSLHVYAKRCRDIDRLTMLGGRFCMSLILGRG